ncbi:MAG: hypothetical protein U1F04_13075 [Burkholderiaceae bacterium]
MASRDGQVQFPSDQKGLLMSLIADLLQRPEKLSAASRFTSVCGLFYLLSGFVLLLWPDIFQVIYREPPFAGHERSLVRVMGMLLAIIGWFYFFGGRTGGRQFVAASVLDRIVLVPIVLGTVAMSGAFPRPLLAFAIIDPVLAIVAWRLLSKADADATPAHGSSDRVA